MGKKNNADQCHTSRELISYAERHGGEVVSQCGSHVKVRGPEGMVIIPNHPGDLATGTRLNIIKTLVKIGIVGFAFFGILLPLLQAYLGG